MVGQTSLFGGTDRNVRGTRHKKISPGVADFRP